MPLLCRSLQRSLGSASLLQAASARPAPRMAALVNLVPRSGLLFRRLTAIPTPAPAEPVQGEEFGCLERSARALLSLARFDRLQQPLSDVLRRAPLELLKAVSSLGASATEGEKRDIVFAAVKAISAILRPPPKRFPKRKRLADASVDTTVAAYVSDLVRLLDSDSLPPALASSYTAALSAHWNVLGAHVVAAARRSRAPARTWHGTPATLAWNVSPSLLRAAEKTAAAMNLPENEGLIFMLSKRVQEGDANVGFVTAAAAFKLQFPRRRAPVIVLDGLPNP